MRYHEGDRQLVAAALRFSRLRGEGQPLTVSLWWVAAAFFVGGYAGAVLVAVMSMARDETAMWTIGVD